MTATRQPLLKATLHYGYFVLQVRATRSASGLALRGVLENLGTGEKWPFEGSNEMARLIEEWGLRSGLGE